MAVQFILGRSGTGKTSYCVKAIVNALLAPGDEQRLILLVPEQATYQAERAILSDKRIAGYNRLNVLSFDRLQFLLSGKNTARPALSRLGQQMIIHRILRDNSGELKVFGPSASWPGLARQMAQTITELHQYAKTPDDIDQLLEKLRKDERNNLTSQKFADIGLIFKEYFKSIESKWTDPDVQLNLACRAVAKAAFVKGAKLWVDGFAGFTIAELAILSELLKAVADAQIALCLEPAKLDLANPDAGKLDPLGLFYPTERTYVELVEVVKKSRLQLAEPIILDTPLRFSHCPQLAPLEIPEMVRIRQEKGRFLTGLAHVERNIFESETSRISAADNIRIIAAPNARAEVQFVARQILQLVKEGNLRYRDIAVIASDIDHYQHYIRASFNDLSLPFFIDKRKPLNQHPVVQFICSALQVITGGFSGSDIFTYLKTDLVPIERCDVDLLENYCLGFGISSGDWTGDNDWHFAPDPSDGPRATGHGFDEQRISQIRLKVSGPLLKLRDKLCPAGDPEKTISAGKFTQVIFDFLDNLGVRQKITKWIEEAIRAGDYATADEHRQFYDKLLNIFDELVEVFAGQQMSCEDYLAILNSAFSQLTLAFIPPSLDQVLVGSIERSRHPDLKAVFLIGAAQRQFPVPVSAGGILTDDDRHACESADFALAVTAGQKLIERQYLAYIAFTRPSQFLYVTYPLTDDKGSAVPRSQFIDNLQSLFENLNEESIAGEQIDIDKVHTDSELSELLCSRLGKDASCDPLQASRQQLGELLSDICLDEQFAELGQTVLSAVNYDNRAQLDKKTIEEFFGRQVDCSATKLGTFAACPYQYFARYILELQERKEFKFEPLDLGNFYHRVLDGLLKKLNKEKKDFAETRTDELINLLSEQIAELVSEDPFISNFARRSAHNTFIIRSAAEVLEDCVPAIAEMVRAGSFRPTLSEISFGKVEGTVETLGEYKISLSDGRLLSLSGKIDRLDIANVNNEKAAVVFDYKRKAKSFSWAKLYYGLDMQLPIYLLAVRNAAGTETKNVIGAFYMPVEAKIGGATPDELPRKVEKFGHKAKGLFNGEFFQQLDTTASSGWCKFYSFRITAGDQQYGDYGKSAALKPIDFEKVLKFTEKKIIQLAKQILSGRIDVTPYRLSRQSPCSYCKYKSVCRFDWQINDYNPLVSLGKLQVLEEIGAKGQRNKGAKERKREG